MHTHRNKNKCKYIRTKVNEVLIQSNEKFDEFCCCVCKNVKSSLFVKGFIQHGFFELMFASMSLHSFEKATEKCYKGVYVRLSSGKF